MMRKLALVYAVMGSFFLFSGIASFLTSVTSAPEMAETVERFKSAFTVLLVAGGAALLALAYRSRK